MIGLIEPHRAKITRVLEAAAMLLFSGDSSSLGLFLSGPSVLGNVTVEFDDSIINFLQLCHVG